MKFNQRTRGLEVISCNNNLGQIGNHVTAEIVCWLTDENKQDYCCTIAYWRKWKEGYDLGFVDNRPFSVDPELFMKLAQQGQNELNAFFDESDQL